LAVHSPSRPPAACGFAIGVAFMAFNSFEVHLKAVMEVVPQHGS
jgi:hypothetical protein